jgi:hypothetical protein
LDAHDGADPGAGGRIEGALIRCCGEIEERFIASRTPLGMTEQRESKNRTRKTVGHRQKSLTLG